MSRKTKQIEPPSKRRKKTDPLKINAGRGFFFLNAALWLGYGVYIYYDMAVLNKNLSSADVVTLFAFVNAGLMFLSGIKLGKPQKWTYFLALASVVFNLALCALNILDPFFTISFIIDLLALWVVLPLRHQYFSER
jgi:hypothetical protein